MKKIFARVLFFSLVGFSVLAATRKLHAFEIKEGEGTLIILAKLPPAYSFIREAPSSLEAAAVTPGVISFPDPLPHHFDPSSGRFTLPFTSRSGQTTVKVKARLYYCEKKSKMCFQKFYETRLTFEVSPRKGPSTVFYIWKITPDTSA